MRLKSLFSQSNFRKTIKDYCDANDWIIDKIDDKRAILRFRMSSGRRQILYIIRYDSTLEFSVPSALAFDSEDDIPHELSTLLLQRSSQKKIGFWCIEKIGGKHVFSCMHNAEMELLNENYFANVVRALIKECDEFEESLSKLS